MLSHLRVLEKLREVAGDAPDDGVGRGYAIHENSNTIVAQCIDVTVSIVPSIRRAWPAVPMTTTTIRAVCTGRNR